MLVQHATDRRETAVSDSGERSGSGRRWKAAALLCVLVLTLAAGTLATRAFLLEEDEAEDGEADGDVWVTYWVETRQGGQAIAVEYQDADGTTLEREIRTDAQGVWSAAFNMREGRSVSVRAQLLDDSDTIRCRISMDSVDVDSNEPGPDDDEPSVYCFATVEHPYG
jgi:hypothetical protein